MEGLNHIDRLDITGCCYNAPMKEAQRVFLQILSLKRTKRTGWVRRGIRHPESVADHSFGCALLALLLAPHLEGVDENTLLKMILIHDLAESDPTVGDITPFDGVSAAEKHQREEVAMQKICSALENGDELLALWNDYEEKISPEAKIAHQIDKLEMALQARDYEQSEKIDLSEFVKEAKGKMEDPPLKKFL